MAESEPSRVSEIASNTLRFYRDPKGITKVDTSGLAQSVLGLFRDRMAIRGVEQEECDRLANMHCDLLQGSSFQNHFRQGNGGTDEQIRPPFGSVPQSGRAAPLVRKTIRCNNGSRQNGAERV